MLAFRPACKPSLYDPELHGLLKKSRKVSSMSGHGFSRADKPSLLTSARRTSVRRAIRFRLFQQPCSADDKSFAPCEQQAPPLMYGPRLRPNGEHLLRIHKRRDA